MMNKSSTSYYLQHLQMLAALCLFACPGYVAAENKTDVANYQSELDKLHDSIANVQDHLKNTQFKRSHVLSDLDKLDKAIVQNEKKLSQTKVSIRNLNKRIRTLKIELTALTKSLKTQRAALSEQLRAAYTMGSQQHLKMLLNQQDPEIMGRIQIYFDYLNNARKSEISTFIDSIARKAQLETESSETRKKQKTALSSRKKQQRQLRAQIIKRNQLLVKLEADIQNQEQTLTSLETNRNRIENLLLSLGELLADIPPNPTDKKPFVTQKGRLPWPVKGTFQAQFGASKQGDLKWNGVLIKTPGGTPVRAISHGRVAFSNWLQGFGFITIVDHSDGYMSLYGHNESLFKQAGDWVNAGEVLATSGASGGQKTPGVYFEIRSRGKPVNPDQWCNSAIKHIAAN